jgi:hypothetical protein
MGRACRHDGSYTSLETLAQKHNLEKCSVLMIHYGGFRATDFGLVPAA